MALDTKRLRSLERPSTSFYKVSHLFIRTFTAATSPLICVFTAIFTLLFHKRDIKA